MLQGTNTVAPGTDLVDLGSLTVGGNAELVVAGQVQIEGQGDLVIDSALHGAGTLDLSGGATLQLAAAAHGETVRFGAGGGLLTLGDPAHAALTLDGLGQLDVVDLTGVSYSATADTIVRTGAGVTIEQNGAVVALFTVGGDTTLALRSDGHGGTELVNTGTYAGIYSGRYYQVVDVRHGAATLAAGSLVEVTLASGGAVYAGPGKTHAITNAGAIEAAGTGGAGVDIAGGGGFINASEGSVSRP